MVGMKIGRSGSPAPGLGWTLESEKWLLFLSLPIESFDTWGPPLLCRLDRNGASEAISGVLFFSMQFLVSGTSQTGPLLRSHSPHKLRDEKRRGLPDARRVLKPMNVPRTSRKSGCGQWRPRETFIAQPCVCESNAGSVLWAHRSQCCGSSCWHRYKCLLGILLLGKACS